MKKADYKDLIPSIKERGILQPLLVRRHSGGYEIIAGRRRLLAACSLKKEGREVEAVPCAIMAKGDNAAAVVRIAKGNLEFCYSSPYNECAFLFDRYCSNDRRMEI